MVVFSLFLVVGTIEEMIVSGSLVSVVAAVRCGITISHCQVFQAVDIVVSISVGVVTKGASLDELCDNCGWISSHYCWNYDVCGC